MCIRYNNLLLLVVLILAAGGLAAQDWADLTRYRQQNDAMQYIDLEDRRVIFMGNSIFENWDTFNPDFFQNDHFINRGISGQTTPQMLLRFRADVIDLKPHAVVILAGTNDIAENTGPTTLKMILDNIFSMVQLAQMNGVEVIMCSILPTRQYPWNLYVKPVEKICKLNIALSNYAKANKIPYVDFYTQMVDEKKGLKRELTYDGVHPNKAGYQKMEQIIQPTLEAVLKLNYE
jgi:lysophospholipase L1-like esterase